VGVPAPAGALLALLPVFMSFEGHVDSSAAPMIVALYLGLIGAAMVSRLPTISPKSILVPREKIIWILIAAPGIAGMMLTRFWLSMILIDLIYVGTLGWSLVSALKKKRARGGSGSH
jgi:CDP-diacylglycerol--serine O-phosphatidyltransferase